MNKYKQNTLWEDFVLGQIIRPFQTMAGFGDKRVEVLTKQMYRSLHPMLIDPNYRDWTMSTLNRIARAFPEIDVSFFPEDELGLFMREILNRMGVKISYFYD